MWEAMTGLMAGFALGVSLTLALLKDRLKTERPCNYKPKKETPLSNPRRTYRVYNTEAGIVTETDLGFTVFDGTKSIFIKKWGKNDKPE